MQILRVMVFVLVTLATGCGKEVYAEPGTVVSMVSLIAEPEKYVGRVIEVRGYLGSISDLPFIFMTEYHSILEDSMSGFFVRQWASGECGDRGVAMVATLNKSSRDGSYYLDNVVSVSVPEGEYRRCYP